MSVTAIISHSGDISTPQLVTDQVRFNAYGLDTGNLTYFSSNADALIEGQADPTYPGLIIDELNRTRDGDIYDFVANCSGIKDTKVERRVRGGLVRNIDLQGWDTYQDTWLTRNRQLFRQGQFGTGQGGTTICTGVTDEHLHGVWYKVTGKFTGILETKPDERSTTCGGREVSHDSVRVNLTGGGTGWTNYRKAVVNLPRIIVTIRRRTTSPPPSQLVPGSSTPPNPPQIKVFSPSGTDLTSNWPNGWTFTFDSKQLGTALYDNTFRYEYVYYQTF